MTEPISGGHQTSTQMDKCKQTLTGIRRNVVNKIPNLAAQIPASGGMGEKGEAPLLDRLS